MKKLIFFILSSFLSSIALAGGIENYVPRDSFSGFYMSFGAGVISGNFNLTNFGEVDTTIVIQGGPHLILSNRFHFYDTGGIGSVGIGYRHLIGSIFVLGLGATADVESLRTRQVLDLHDLTSGFHFTRGFSVRLRNTFALILKPGFLLDQQNLFYFLVGPRWGNFRTSAESQFSFTVFQATTGPLAYNRVSRYKTGFTVGLGMEHYFCHGLSLALEYDYSYYSRIRVPDAQVLPIIFSDGQTEQVIGVMTHVLRKVNVGTQAVLLSLFYRF